MARARAKVKAEPAGQRNRRPGVAARAACAARAVAGHRAARRSVARLVERHAEQFLDLFQP
jgi:hypothetical protein